MRNNKILIVALSLVALVSMGAMDARLRAPLPKGGSPLPYDAEIEYLQGDGVAYIDTGIWFGEGANSHHYKLSVEFLYKGGDLNGYITGYTGRSGTGTQAPVMFIRANNSSGMTVLVMSSAVAYGGRYYINPSTEEYNKVDITANNKNYSSSLNGVEMFNFVYTTSATYYGINQKVFLFTRCINGGSTDAVGTPKICGFYFKNYNSNEEVDLIPVRVGSVGYMYDKISGQLFGNAASSGAFILGADK